MERFENQPPSPVNFFAWLIVIGILLGAGIFYFRGALAAKWQALRNGSDKAAVVTVTTPTPAPEEMATPEGTPLPSIADLQGAADSGADASAVTTTQSNLPSAGPEEDALFILSGSGMGYAAWRYAAARRAARGYASKIEIL